MVLPRIAIATHYNRLGYRLVPPKQQSSGRAISKHSIQLSMNHLGTSCCSQFASLAGVELVEPCAKASVAKQEFVQVAGMFEVVFPAQAS